MRIKTNIVKLLAVLVILGSLVAIAAVPASAVVAAYAIPTPTGPVGSSVSIQATNFTEGQILTAKFDGVPMGTSPATVTVPVSTNINFTVNVPVTTGGAHQIEVFRDGQTITTQTPVIFTVQPKVTVTSPPTKQGAVGSAVTVAGTGFSGASVSATVTIGGLPVGGPVSVDSTGSFTAIGTVPAVGAGLQKVSAKDGAGNSAYGPDNSPAGSWDNRADFSVTPTLAVNPTNGLGGSKVTISGTGWTPNQVNTLVVKLTGQSWTTVSTDGSGNILPQSPQPVITPSSPLGSNQIVGYDTNYPTVPAATTTFTVDARSLTVTPVSSGPRGTQLLVTGTNMTPSTTIFTSKILANSLVIIGTSSISLYGTDILIDTQGVIIPTTVYIPVGASLGANTIKATDNSGLVATATFTVTKPSITINTANGPRGTSVIVNGYLWLPPSTVWSTAVTIGVYPYGQTTGTLSIPEVTTIPDSSGSFAAGITIPNVPAAGTYSIYARDANSNAAVLATFTVPGAAITVSPQSGVALDTITVNGTGFKPYWGITVSIGGYNFPQQVFSNVLGAFTFSGQVPGLAPGAATVVSATDGTSAATTFFTLNAGAPTVKSIVTPIASKLVIIWGYSGGTWYMYDPADAAGSSLLTLTAGNGYWIKVSADCILVYGGYSYSLSSAAPGWTNIGWR